MSGVDIANLVISVAGLSICGLGLAQAIAAGSMEKRTQQYFIAFFSILFAYVSANFAGQWTYNVIFQMTALFLESALSSILTLLILGFLLESSGEADRRRAPAFRVAAGLEIVYLALLVYTQFSTTIYYYDASGLYHRGPYYPVLLVPPICIMLLNLCVLRSRRDRLSKAERMAFAAYILAPLACMVIQVFFFGVYVIVLGSSLGAMVMFLNIQRYQTERYVKQEAENERLRREIMLSQIQPHFLYNTLGAIGYLCRDNPEANAHVS